MLGIFWTLPKQYKGSTDRSHDSQDPCYSMCAFFSVLVCLWHAMISPGSYVELQASVAAARACLERKFAIDASFSKPSCCWAGR